MAGIWVGDAFGERFFGHQAEVLRRITAREVPQGTWRFTDDTAMALSVRDSVLAGAGHIDPDVLVQLFAQRYHRDPVRGYGPGTHRFMSDLFGGMSWQFAAKGNFDGTGSFGNGAAMRVAPIGAYHFDDYTLAAEAADQSAAVTHMHPDGRAGAIAVAVATAWFIRGGSNIAELFDTVLAHTPEGRTRLGIAQAAELPRGESPPRAASVLGNGSAVSAQDTVPFTLWVAARHLDNFEEAIWSTVSGLGDRDTTCAIVGGMLAARPGATLPPAWLAACEPLDALPAG